MNPFDPSTAPIGEPDELVSGTFHAWRSELDITNVGFTCEYTFRSIATGASFTIPGVFQSTGLWSFSALSSLIGASPEGEYQWRLFVIRSSDNERIELRNGFARLFGSTADRRSHARIMVAKIESILQRRADSDVANYTIKGRQIDKIPVEELIRWRNYYRSEIQTEDAMRGDSVNRQSIVKVRFSQE